MYGIVQYVPRCILKRIRVISNYTFPKYSKMIVCYPRHGMTQGVVIQKWQNNISNNGDSTIIIKKQSEDTITLLQYLQVTTHSYNPQVTTHRQWRHYQNNHTKYIFLIWEKITIVINGRIRLFLLNLISVYKLQHTHWENYISNSFHIEWDMIWSWGKFSFRF